MNYYIQGSKEREAEIKAAFKQLGCEYNGIWCSDILFYFTLDGKVYATAQESCKAIIKTHPDYKELELPVEPKFKAEDRIVSKSDKSTIYRIITLHEERREYIVEIEHKDYHESCPWIAFEDQDDYELAPKPHYDIANFYAGMPVLVRADNSCKWDYSVFSRVVDNEYWHFAVCNGVCFTQCIPFNNDTKHLLGTTDMPSEEYINW